MEDSFDGIVENEMDGGELLRDQEREEERVQWEPGIAMTGHRAGTDSTAATASCPLGPWPRSEG